MKSSHSLTPTSNLQCHSSQRIKEQGKNPQVFSFYKERGRKQQHTSIVHGRDSEAADLSFWKPWRVTDCLELRAHATTTMKPRTLATVTQSIRWWLQFICRSSLQSNMCVRSRSTAQQILTTCDSSELPNMQEQTPDRSDEPRYHTYLPWRCRDVVICAHGLIKCKDIAHAIVFVQVGENGCQNYQCVGIGDNDYRVLQEYHVCQCQTYKCEGDKRGR